MDIRLWKKLTTVLTAEPEISVQAENECAALVQHSVFVHSVLATKSSSQGDNKCIMFVLTRCKPQ